MKKISIFMAFLLSLGMVFFTKNTETYYMGTQEHFHNYGFPLKLFQVDPLGNCSLVYDWHIPMALFLISPIILSVMMGWRLNRIVKIITSILLLSSLAFVFFILPQSWSVTGRVFAYKFTCIIYITWLIWFAIILFFQMQKRWHEWTDCCPQKQKVLQENQMQLKFLILAALVLTILMAFFTKNFSFQYYGTSEIYQYYGFPLQLLLVDSPGNICSVDGWRMIADLLLLLPIVVSIVVGWKTGPAARWCGIIYLLSSLAVVTFAVAQPWPLSYRINQTVYAIWVIWLIIVTLIRLENKLNLFIISKKSSTR